VIKIQVPAWMGDAVCAQTDPELFFPEKGASSHEARRVCRGCGVRKECLEFALKTGQRFGVWGGVSERQRRSMKRIA
jgi:WhiB family redox-sensing transcriptional regulator